MFIDKNSLIIDGINIGEYIIDATYSYNKLWSKNAGRSLSGKMTGSIIGIFPKINVQFRPLDKNELVMLSKIFDKANQSVTYFDPYLNRTTTMTTYTGDWEIKNKNINENTAFSISFISVERRK